MYREHDPKGHQGGIRGGGPEYFDEKRVDPMSADVGGGGGHRGVSWFGQIRSQNFGTLAPITSEPLIQTISSLYSIALRETDLSVGEGFEAIGVPISEIPNYTVKNRCCDMCWPISIDNSVTQQ